MKKIYLFVGITLCVPIFAQASYYTIVEYSAIVEKITSDQKGLIVEVALGEPVDDRGHGSLKSHAGEHLVFHSWESIKSERERGPQYPTNISIAPEIDATKLVSGQKVYIEHHDSNGLGPNGIVGSSNFTLKRAV